jgi:hypothetical protein
MLNDAGLLAGSTCGSTGPVKGTTPSVGEWALKTERVELIHQGRREIVTARIHEFPLLIPHL